MNRKTPNGSQTEGLNYSEAPLERPLSLLDGVSTHRSLNTSKKLNVSVDLVPLLLGVDPVSRRRKLGRRLGGDENLHLSVRRFVSD